jgi:AcrR family transcriptional regulator
MTFLDASQLNPYILQLEQAGLVRRTFRRLDPQRQIDILGAILDEASERGPASVNIKHVAKRAGVSVGSLYQYFPDRDTMLAFVVELCVRFTTDAFNEFLPYLAAMPLREALKLYLAGGIEWSQDQSRWLQLFARAAYQGDPELAQPLVRPIASLMLKMVHDILEAAVRRGEIRPEVDLEASTRLVNALTIAASDSLLLPYLNNYFQVHDASMPEERMTEALLDLILKGIGVEAA